MTVAYNSFTVILKHYTITMLKCNSTALPQLPRGFELQLAELAFQTDKAPHTLRPLV